MGFRYWSFEVAAKMWNGTSFNYVEGIFALNMQMYKILTACPMRGIFSFQVLSAAGLIP
jgi:hypothetical protein